MSARLEDIGFQRYAASEPQVNAIVDPSGRLWSRGELAALANRTAHALQGAGLLPGDTVAIAAPNCAEYLAVYFGAVAAGCYVVSINWHLAGPEVAYLMSDARPRVLFVHARLGRAFRGGLLAHLPAGCLVVSIGDAPQCTSLAAFTDSQPSVPPASPIIGRALPYTSATTGRPKAVQRPLEGARAALAKTIAWHASVGRAPGKGHVNLCASMLYHTAPLEGAVVALEMGHTVVLADRWDAATLLDSIDRHGVTTAFMVPFMFVRLLRLPERARRGRGATLRCVVHGGAPCPPQIKRAMIDWWGPIIWEAYGSTEAQGTVVSSEEWLARPGTVGRAIPGAAIRILDELGNDLPPRVVGAVYIASHTREQFAYRGAAPEPGWRHGEFVTVGDLGYLDEDGYLFLCGRRSDLIISSGMNIYPAEIEAQLIQHTAVNDCAVIGQRHELCGEVPVAVVELAPGASPGTKLTHELQQFLAARLSTMKLPRRIDYVEKIPRDPSGKLFHRLLREGRAA